MDIRDIIFVSIIPVTLLLLLCVVLIFLWLQRKQAGVSLAVIPLPQLQRNIFMVLGTGSIVAGFRMLKQAPNSGDITVEYIFFLSAGSLLFGLGSSLWWRVLLPIEIRELGILLHGSLIQWSQIQSYRWQGRDRRELIISLRHRQGFLKKQKFLVSPRNWLTVERVLQQKLDPMDGAF